MNRPALYIVIIIFTVLVYNLVLHAQTNPDLNIRSLVDTVGYAHLDWQMDSIITRINRCNHYDLMKSVQAPGTVWKTAICPHDDYAYAGWIYQSVLRNIRAKTVIIFGVAHKAKSFNLENQLVFDSYKYWHGPYGPVKISAYRDEIIHQLPEDMVIVHNEMQSVEHSVEGLLPFLQYQTRDAEIISILVPYMDFERISSISQQLSKALFNLMKKNNLNWGEDIALLISSDAVHYGDEDWGGKSYALYGCDSSGNVLAVSHEWEIINTCFAGELTREKVAQFYSYTVNPDDFKEYKWTWCGRYSIPLGLLTSIYLQQLQNDGALKAVPVAYANSISQAHLKVDDLRMGTTAVATPHHWVGYPAIGFK